ncbi:MAG: type II toxin-antitoxin system death-on-curing family toxin [Acidimicrobiia bacterium]|nr:type II toxin-antitoxin system death-on-curing family toxin [Acidimicrobiia bacterium]
MVYLDLDDLLAAATAVLGDEPGVRDYGLLESALARPQATVFGEDAYTDIHAKAAALLSSLVKNHALVDGNKRLGLVSVRLFYALNDYVFDATDDQKFELVIGEAEGRTIEIDEIARTLEEFTSPRA